MWSLMYKMLPRRLRHPPSAVLVVVDEQRRGGPPEYSFCGACLYSRLSTRTCPASIQSDVEKMHVENIHSKLHQARMQGMLNMQTPLRARLSLRGLKTSAISEALGVVENLKDEEAIAIPAEKSRSFWEVIEFRQDGTALETWKTPEVLRLHPRDVHLFTNDSSSARRAMIAPRGDCILFRTEIVRSIIYKDKTIVFPCRRMTETIHVAQTVKRSISQRSALPFELKVLESLLSETTSYFEKKYQRLVMVADTVTEDINQSFHETAAELQRFIPITRKLNELINDVDETLSALVDVADHDPMLSKMCLTERSRILEARLKSRGYASGEEPAQEVEDERSDIDSRSLSTSEPVRSLASSLKRSPHMKMASTILESYEFKLLNTKTALNELSENLEQNRIVWHMQLDHQRNKVLKFNVSLSIASLAGLISTLPAAYFGMNLHSGLEEHEGMLWTVAQGSIGGGLALAILMYLYYNVQPTRLYSERLGDMRSLRDLLFYHMDDLDVILDAVKAQKTPLTEKGFSKIVREALKGKSISPKEIALLYRVIDRNKEAVLEMSEMIKEETDLSHHLT